MKRKIAAIAAICTAVLVVSGVLLGTAQSAWAKGEEDFRIDGTTLTAYVGNDAFVSIPDSVIKIGESAFAGNESIQKIEIPNSVTTISYNAFGDCTALTEVSIPDSVNKVGPGAFKGCTSLELVEIGASVRSWGSGVFNDCTALSSLIMDDNNRYLTYYNGALYNGDMSFLYQVLGGREGENFVTPIEVKEIDTYAFWNLKNVKNIMISDKVTNIPAYAMSNMGSVENVILQDHVVEIAQKAFANNENLKQVLIPKNVTKIDESAFTNCPNVQILTTKESEAAAFGKKHKLPVIYKAALAVDFNDSNPSNQEKPDLNRKIVIETIVEKLPTIPNEELTGDSTQVNGSYVDNFKVEETQEDSSQELVSEEELGNVIGKATIVNGQAVLLMNNHSQKVYGTPADSTTDSTEETTEEKSEETTEEKSKDEESSETKTEEVSEEAPSKETSENKEEHKQESTQNSTTKPSASTNSKTIPNREFYKQKDLTNYIISEKIICIERLAFARSGLQKIEIPSSVKTIEYGAFYACDDLTEVTIADSVTEISTKAFADTPWLNNWLADTENEEKFLIVGEGILLAYRGNAKEVVIPDGVKQIGSEVFEDHKELKKVTIPSSVTKICADAFRNCSNLTEVSGAESLKSVVRGAFYGTNISEEDL